jgi:hypothetical protein
MSAKNKNKQNDVGFYRKTKKMNDLNKAKELLLANGYTCVVCRNNEIYTSVQRGVTPLIEWHKGDTDLSGFCAADKVVGKGAAFLYVLLGINEVYAAVISRPALDVLLSHGIKTEYGILADNIINRSGDGICPIESAVLGTYDPHEAYSAIVKKLQEISGKKTF